MKQIKRVIVCVLILVVAINLVACTNTNKQSTKFEYWNEGDVLTGLKTYVTTVTNEQSKGDNKDATDAEPEDANDESDINGTTQQSTEQGSDEQGSDSGSGDQGSDTGSSEQGSDSNGTTDQTPEANSVSISGSPFFVFWGEWRGM